MVIQSISGPTNGYTIDIRAHEWLYNRYPGPRMVIQSILNGSYIFGTMQICSTHGFGVVGCGEGVVYLTCTSPGRQTDTGLQSIKACYPSKGRRGFFFISSVPSLSFPFLLLPCLSLSSPLLSLQSLFSLSLGEDTK